MFRFFKNSTHIFKKKQEDILSAAFVIGLSVAISRILGLVRYRLLAARFGDEIKLFDSFIAASNLSDAIFEVLIFGTIALAFIPIFSSHLSKDFKKAWELSSKVITIGIVLFLIFAALIMIFANSIAPFIAPGVVEKDPTTQIVLARLLRVMIIAQLFFVFSIFLTGILQSFQRFVIPALASVFYNIGIIISIIFLSPIFGIYAPALGMILGALLHLVIQLPLVMSLGFKFRPSIDFRDRDVTAMFKMMWPRSIALGLTRASDVINISLASFTAIGSIVAFNFAQVLQVVPAAFFAGPIAQAAFPSLSIEINNNRIGQFKKVFIQSYHQILFLVLPAMAILAILRIPVVRLVFGARELPWEITVLTGRTLLAFSVGIAAQAVNLLLIRAFHALRDSFTPVRVNLIFVPFNIVLSLIFIFVLKLSIIWLAAAYSVSNILASLFLLYFLDRKVGGFDRSEFFVPVFKMLVITFITALSLYIPMKLMDQLVFDTTRTLGLLLLTTIAATVGLSIYIFLSLVMKVQQVVIFWHFAKRVSHWPSKIMTPAATSIDAQKSNP